MADHNFLTDTYDSNTAILNECKGYIADVVLPSEPVSQFDDDGIIARMVINTINSILGQVSQLFEGQAYMYRFAKKGVSIVDTDYGNKLNDSIEDVGQIVSSIKIMTETLDSSKNLKDVVYVCPVSLLASIYIRNASIDFNNASDEELENYYNKLFSLDETELSEDEKRKIEEYMVWLFVKMNAEFAFGTLTYDEECLNKYVELYEKVNPEKAKTVDSYMDNYSVESRNKKELYELKYQIYTSDYRYNLISSYQNGQMNNKVYDLSNYDHYGSRQHSAICFISGQYDYLYSDDVDYLSEKEEQYKKIIANNVSKGEYKKIAGTHGKLQTYLSEINSHGCGYAAVVNTIFNYYIGKEDKFKDTFGYDMYDKYGDLNYDLLLVDVYTSRKKPTKHESLTTDNNDDFTSEFMIKHEVPSTSKDHANVTPENYYEYALKGYQVTVALTNCKDFEYSTTYDRENKAYVMTCTPYDGQGDAEGHAMTVTGVTYDGRFIVSSWGEKFILDSNLDSRINVSFTIVRYNS